MPHNPERTRENDFVLPGDPEVWTEAYRAWIERHGDHGDNCVMCGRRTGGKANTAFVLVSHHSTALPVDEMPAEGAIVDGEPYDESGDTMGCFPIGSECAKRLDPKYLCQAGLPV